MKKFYAFPFFILFIFCGANEHNTNKQVPNLEQVKNIDNSKHHVYSWLSAYNVENKLVNRIAAPKGFERSGTNKNSYTEWLRNIPLKAGSPKVKLYNGALKGNQNAQFAVVDIDVGTKDLQQCADAAMRLRAEYLFANQKYDQIAFNFTSGDRCAFTDWANGKRPIIVGNKVNFQQKANKDYSYANFKKYMETIFSYCGTYSLEKELKKVTNLAEIQAGDIFIMGGFPGHAVTVMDVAQNPKTAEKVFLLSQSYMPAQDIHILKNPTNSSISPWFSINFENELITPEWTFKKTALKRF